MKKISIPTKQEAKEIANFIESELKEAEKIKFNKGVFFRDFPKSPGVYMVFEDGKPIYIGETADLRDRMKDLQRTYNHSLRKKLGKSRLNGKVIKNKFADDIEMKLTEFMKKHISISFYALCFGRKEVEFIIFENNPDFINSTSNRGKK